jgi:hypothetical protein
VVDEVFKVGEEAHQSTVAPVRPWMK